MDNNFKITFDVNGQFTCIKVEEPCKEQQLRDGIYDDKWVHKIAHIRANEFIMNHEIKGVPENLTYEWIEDDEIVL